MAKKLYITLGFALVYTLTAQLSIVLWQLPGWYLAFVWPPAGIAVAALILLGRQVLPGIFLGVLSTVLINMETVSQPLGLGIALFVAATSTLRTFLAAAIIARIVPRTSALVSGAQLATASIAILLVCFIAAFGNVAIRYVSDIEPKQSLLSIWSLRAVGDYCGLMIFGPLAWWIGRTLLAPQKATRPDPIVNTLMLNSLFTAMAAFAFTTLWQSENSAISQALKRESDVAANKVTQELREAGHDLEAIRALIYASDSVTAEEFRLYTTAEFEGRRHYVAQAVGYAPRVTHPERWNQLVKGNSPAGTFLYEFDNSGQRIPATQREDYFPVQYIQPIESNEVAIGFDLGSERSRRIALDRALDTGQVSMVAPIALVQSDGTKLGLLMCAPIYSADARLETVAARRASHTGYASAVHLVDELFEQALTDSNGDVDLHLFDETVPDDVKWYHTKVSSYRAQGEPVPAVPLLKELDEGFSGTSPIEFASYKWRVVATPGPAFIGEQRTMTPWGALFLILVLGTVCSSIILERIEGRKRVQAERRKTEQALREARSANESMSYFMAAASHDIKQPLYALGILTDTLLMSDAPNDSSVPLLHNLRNSITQMAKHFDALMDVSSFHGSTFEPNPRIISLSDLSARVDLEIAPLCNEKGLAWKLDMDRLLIYTDEELLLRLLRNLLINAVEYTDHGEVACIAKAEGDVVNFLISDTGKGIDSQYQEKFFKESMQLGKSERHSTGSGLGLSIVARINRSLQLHLSMTSTAGKGTSFSFQVPRVYRSGHDP